MALLAGRDWDIWTSVQVLGEPSFTQEDSDQMTSGYFLYAGRAETVC
jgi:hypothetical protein